MINKEINTRINVTLTHEVMKEITRIADEYGISKSKAIATIINEYLKSES